MSQFLCVYCGSSAGHDPAFADAARELGAQMVAGGFGLVYGGASVGIMGVMADTVLAAGGRVIGVLPKSMSRKEVAHPSLDELHLVDSMHQRKKMMEELSQGMIALPGGFGTLEEMFEVLTWAQLGYHQKPVGLLNVRGFYNELLSFLDRITENGFVKPKHRALLQVADNSRELLAKFAAYQPPALSKWLDRGDQL